MSGQPASHLVALGERWQAVGGDASGFLSRVQGAHPDDFWANLALGKAMEEKAELEAGAGYDRRAMVGGEVQAGVGYDRRAQRIRPGVVAAYLNIAHARIFQNWLDGPDGAIENARRALQIDPRSAVAHNNLGWAWKNKGLHDVAIDEYREALRIDPELGPAHRNLGEVLASRGSLAEAIDHDRQALRIEPECAGAHYLLGLALLSRGRFDEADENHRRALRVDPGNREAHDWAHGLAIDDAVWHYHETLRFDPAWAPTCSDLGGAGPVESRLDEAIDRYREALRINAGIVEAHRSLSQALLAQGHPKEAMAASRSGLERLSRDHHLSPGVTQDLQRCQRLLALEGRLPAVLGGKDRAADVAEGLDFADLCRIERRYAAAAGFFAEALATRPRLADDQRTRVRNHAPLVAILADSGCGEDAGKLSEAERARWRRQAREWMRADLEAWIDGRDGGPEMHREAVRTLTHWRGDPDLAAMRDPAALGKLPPAERRECEKLWSEIDASLHRLKGW